jgi:SAM-dependent methyltransferase
MQQLQRPRKGMKDQLPADHPARVFAFACPACKTPLAPVDENSFACPYDGRIFSREDGIWRFLLTEREAYFNQFIEEYGAIRRLEGRGNGNPDFYRSLPYQDLTGKWARDWRIRAISFSSFVSNFLIPFEDQFSEPLNIIDMGAGNGWLSNRLTLRGHRVIAIDLQLDQFDGLGASSHYEASFAPIQAEFDRLPVSPGQFDLVIFNASFHYATDYLSTLREALFAIKVTGRVIILDTPLYKKAESGVRMVTERMAEFTARFGFPSDAIPSQNFLTEDQIKAIGSELGLRWQKLEPGFGLKWALRPWLAALRHQREPATFPILIGMKIADHQFSQQ